jgi:uncharacterized Zn-binding protein involved in type VI secretion
MPAVIVIGDRTSHGGVVIGCSMVTDTCGKGIARVGDQVTCPMKGHGTNVIATGDPTFMIDGMPVARHGDKTACGATLIASQGVTTDNPGGMSSASMGSNSSSAAASVAALAVSSALATEDHTYDMHWQIKDKDTGLPAANIPYRITLENGKSIQGVTDASGFTDKVGDTYASTATIEAPYHGDSASNSYPSSEHDACGC